MLHLATAKKQSGGILFDTASLEWRKEAKSLNDPRAVSELANALRQLGISHQLHAIPLYFALSSDYCVTRAVTGTSLEVYEELTAAQERSSLYLSLGHGAKITSTGIHQIDARHDHALLAVANERSLNVITQAVAEANLIFEVVEPSLTSLCRLVGEAELDSTDPVLVTIMGENTVELAISHGGRPLLEYRPAGKQASREIATLVAGHLSRLKRHCQRRLTSGSELGQIVITGEEDETLSAVNQFPEVVGLPTRALRGHHVCPDWNFSSGDPKAEQNAALGAVLIGLKANAVAEPNFASEMAYQQEHSTLPLIARAFWPLAASVVLVIAAWQFVGWERARLETTEAQIEEQIPQGLRVKTLTHQVNLQDALISAHRKMEDSLPKHNWGNLASRIAMCMPTDVWLETLEIDANGKVNVKGVAYSEDAAYQFSHWLKADPCFTDVSLVDVIETKLHAGTGATFRIECLFTNSREESTSQEEFDDE